MYSEISNGKIRSPILLVYQKRALIKTVKGRQLDFLGHIYRNDGIEKTVIIKIFKKQKERVQGDDNALPKWGF